MINKLDIFGLFSEFDYTIDLPKNGEQLILTGPNGYGKTTILSMIKALCSLDLLYFYSIPFRSIRVHYDSYELDIVSIKEKDNAIDDSQIEIHYGIKFNLIDSNKYKMVASLCTDVDKISTVEKSLEWNSYFDSSRLNDSHDFSFSKIKGRLDAESANKKGQILEKLASLQTSLGPFMFLMRNLSIKAKFIQAQRLMKPTFDPSKEIERVAFNISTYLKNQHYKFLTNSQAHDSQFISRLMNENEEISKAEYENSVKTISDFVNIANRFDLGAYFFIPPYDKAKSGILKAYIEDIIEKLSVYTAPVDDLALFEKLTDDKEFVGKRCLFNRRDGIRFVADCGGSNIPLEVLSSGEKNQIIMLHDFIFNIEDGTILMIDEPEISLHVAWQHEFMKDISEIAKAKKLSVIIATHSPQIIGSRWEECLDLYEVSEQTNQPT